MKAFCEIGLLKTMRYVTHAVFVFFFGMLCISSLRIFFLKSMGAKIGKNCIVHGVRFFNGYRGGFSNLVLEDDCFIGDETLIDLAGQLVLENKVTLAERVMVLTHMNVGYQDHPLQVKFPATAKGVRIGCGSFIGAGAIILDGTEIGSRSFVAAGAVVRGNIPSDSMVAGVPAKVIRSI